MLLETSANGGCDGFSGSRIVRQTSHISNGVATCTVVVANLHVVKQAQ